MGLVGEGGTEGDRRMRDPKAYGKGEAPHLGLVEDPASTTQAGPPVPGLRAPKSPSGFRRPHPHPRQTPEGGKGGGRGHETHSPLLEPLCKGLRAQRPLLSGPVSTSSAFIIPGQLAFLCPHPPPLPPSLQQLLSPHHVPIHLLPSPQSVPCPLINILSPNQRPSPNRCRLISP